MPHLDQIFFLEGLLAVYTIGPLVDLKFFLEVKALEILLFVDALIGVVPGAAEEGVHARALDLGPAGVFAHLLHPELIAEQQINGSLLIDLKEQNHLADVNAP
jgi:hypothetical protein